MTAGPQVSTAFTYLFRDHPKTVWVERIDGKTVRVRLPNLSSGECESIELSWDERDQRTLIVCDGDLLWQGLPRAAEHLDALGPHEIKIKLAQMRVARPFEEGQPNSIEVRSGGPDGQASLWLWRHLLLLPATAFCFRRYEPNCLGRYCLVQVRRQGNRSVVTWRNSAY